MLAHLPQILLAAYLIIINIIGFATMADDKHRAKKKEWRVPESRFFLISILGGSIGTYAGMKLFHHKTLHKKFTIGIPLIIVIQIILIVRFVIIK